MDPCLTNMSDVTHPTPKKFKSQAHVSGLIRRKIIPPPIIWNNESYQKQPSVPVYHSPSKPHNIKIQDFYKNDKEINFKTP